MKAFILLVCVAFASSKPAGDDDVFGNVIGVMKGCAEKDISLCLKEKTLRYLENVNMARELDITDGITVVGTGSSRSARSYEPLPEEPKARESQVENRLLDAAADFMENHVIQLRIPKGTVDDVKRSLEEGRSKKKKQLKQLQPILQLLMLKFQSMIPLFLAIIAFAAIKGLMLAKAALLASALVLLKKLLSKNDHHESYEVVAHPHHEEHFSHGGGHGGWGRASQDAQNMAYSAYAN
ncbi:hypothetical protein K1T71_013652 [Dendrolimus kikuchii]|uniref:Uncharacterized protein n=1 Tax=Dendrolimus kikuchii TaxID=765133 RepID=A0ACC1CH30_9NEOP|nr:hypothetical protein K1T71_013652 [Dendrolimus kikuchii]